MRIAIRLLLRAYSYLFHLILALFLIGISSVAISSGKPLSLGMLPWEGEKLNHATLALGIVGLVCVLLTATGVLRLLLPVWAMVILILMFRGFFMSSFHFTGEDQFKGAAWLTFGAFGAFLSSLAILDRRRKRP